MHELRQAQGVSSKMGFEGPHMNFVNVQHRPSHGKKKNTIALGAPAATFFLLDYSWLSRIKYSCSIRMVG
jgi:hypothetical protein